MSEVAVLNDARRVQAVLSPVRRRLLRALRGGAESAAGLAGRLRQPRQKLNYHLRALERAGLVELAETRRRRGCVERTLRPTARGYLIGPALLGDLGPDPDAVQDRFSSAYLVALAGRLAHDVSHLERGAAKAGKRLATVSMATEVRFRSAEQRAAFAQELTEALARLASKYHDASPAGRPYRFVVGGHPVVKSGK